MLDDVSDVPRDRQKFPILQTRGGGIPWDSAVLMISSFITC
jgi:hypothetical protein